MLVLSLLRIVKLLPDIANTRRGIFFDVCKINFSLFLSVTDAKASSNEQFRTNGSTVVLRMAIVRLIKLNATDVSFVVSKSAYNKAWSLQVCNK